MHLRSAGRHPLCVQREHDAFVSVAPSTPSGTRFRCGGRAARHSSPWPPTPGLPSGEPTPVVGRLVAGVPRQAHLRHAGEPRFTRLVLRRRLRRSTGDSTHRGRVEHIAELLGRLRERRPSGSPMPFLVRSARATGSSRPSLRPWCWPRPCPCRPCHDPQA